MKYARRFFMAAAVMLLISGIPAFAAGEAEKVFLQKSGNSKLFLLIPSGGEQKDSLLMLELNEKTPYENGYQHGWLLADNIADVVSNRYSCINRDILDWVQDSYYKMPRDFQDEIRGIADGIAAKGHSFPFTKIVLHATQPLTATAVGFPWFLCPWDEGSGPTGSFSYAVWGRYTPTGTALSINSPDWGSVPKSLAHNRVLVSVRPSSGFRYVYLGVAGVVGMPGANETGLSIAGTAGLPGLKAVTSMPGNGIPVPYGFMSPFMIAAHVLRNFSGTDPLVFDRFESEVLRVNPVDGFILQLSTPTNSALWEPGAAASPDYPANSRRMAGEWDAGNITPVDWRGDFVLMAGGEIFRISKLPFPAVVDYNDSAGNPYSGRAWINGTEMHWRRMLLGRAFALPSDPNRVSEYGNAGNPHIVNIRSDKTGGYWVLADGSDYGSWARDGDSMFRVYNSDGAEVCSGPLYDFGNGVAGRCSLGANTGVDFVAWTHQYPDGSNNRLDGMNLSVLPQTKQWSVTGFPLFGGPHSRTHFLMRELGAPKGILLLDEFFRVFQRAYLTDGTENQPFGVGVYDLASGDGIFTVSRYEGDRYLGGLNPGQKPIKLNRYQLFGW